VGHWVCASEAKVNVTVHAASSIQCKTRGIAAREELNLGVSQGRRREQPTVLPDLLQVPIIGEMEKKRDSQKRVWCLGHHCAFYVPDL
jgi:hypothetical protein